MSKSNTDLLDRRANRRQMPKPVRIHVDKNRYTRKQKHRKGLTD